MKINFIYIILAFLSLSMIAGIQVLIGIPFHMFLRILFSIFAITTLQEVIVMVVFLALPFIITSADAFKKKKKATSKS